VAFFFDEKNKIKCGPCFTARMKGRRTIRIGHCHNKISRDLVEKILRLMRNGGANWWGKPCKKGNGPSISILCIQWQGHLEGYINAYTLYMMCLRNEKTSFKNDWYRRPSFKPWTYQWQINIDKREFFQ